VGPLSSAVLARTDWSFGFIQAIKTGQFFASWSGVKSNAGSVSVNILNTADLRKDTDDTAAAPFTRPRAIRFTFEPTNGKIKCQTNDSPSFGVPSSIKNLTTSADNFLDFVKDARQLCCALVVEEQAETPKLRFLAHSIWDIRLAFSLRWVKGNIVVSNSSKVSVGQFKFGPPDDPDFKKMLDSQVLAGDSYNKVASDELTRNVTALHSDKKTESGTWFLSTPPNFFTP
jgi:hypothetical protein